VQNEHELAARFWAGYCAAVAFSGLAPLLWIDDRRMVELLRGVAIKGLDMNVEQGSECADDVGGLLVTSQRRQSAAALRENLDMIERDDVAWSAIPQRLADRVGLIFCGDLSTAISEILHAEGWASNLSDPRTREIAVQQPRTAALMRYALFDDYYLIRYESGLSQRPWLFS
jgi:hypothetical protein